MKLEWILKYSCVDNSIRHTIINNIKYICLYSTIQLKSRVEVIVMYL